MCDDMPVLQSELPCYAFQVQCGLLTRPHDVNSQIRLSESSTNRCLRPALIDSALHGRGILVGSGHWQHSSDQSAARKRIAVPSSWPVWLWSSCLPAAQKLNSPHTHTPPSISRAVKLHPPAWSSTIPTLSILFLSSNGVWPGCAKESRRAEVHVLPVPS